MREVTTFEYQQIKAFKFGYHPFTRPKLHVHIYFVDGLLIDTGQSRMQKDVISNLRHLEVNQIFISHHHEDHSGNIAEIHDLYKCPVFASPRCCELMQSPPKISFAQKMVWGDRPPFKEIRPVPNELKTKNYYFQVIPIPGHAEDMLALYEPNHKWLFSADLYINSYISYFLKDESMRKQMESMRSILKLDFETMFCSHNPKMTGGKAQVKKKLDYFESFFDQVSTYHQKGYGVNQIMKEMELKEQKLIKMLSGGMLSKANMVASAIRDLKC